MQDARAAADVTRPLERWGDVAAIPVSWYWPRALILSTEMDIVPMPSAGKRGRQLAMKTMGRVTFGTLRQAWTGEAADFTPLLKEQLDILGERLGIDLESIGQAEVVTTGGRRIDIVAEGLDGSEFVIENQYGIADHDHLTRGLAYAVARKARGLIVIAEEHRDEFRALAEYLNTMAEADQEGGIAVWLVEAKAIRINDTGPWAPLFTPVVAPNSFVTTVSTAKHSVRRLQLPEFVSSCPNPATGVAIATVLERWTNASRRFRITAMSVVLEAIGPAVNRWRTVVALYPNGHVLIPLGAYAGQNSGIPIEQLQTERFIAQARAIFGFAGTPKQVSTITDWLSPTTVDELVAFCETVADAYSSAMSWEDVV